MTKYVTGSLVGDLRACSTGDDLYAAAVDEIERQAADLRSYAKTMEAISALPPTNGYPGYPMSDADLTRHYEASKCDVVGLVGSEVRQIIGELRHHRESGGSLK